jgi:predicted transcriptional regulator
MFFRVGNLQTAVKAMSMAAEAVQLNRQGMSGVEIAKQLGVCEATVCNYLRRALESQSLFGSELTPEEVAERRSLRRERLLANEVRLIERRERLRALLPDIEGEEFTPDIESECMAANAYRNICDSITKTSAELALLDGLNVKPDGPSIMNNLQVNIGPNELSALPFLQRELPKELLAQNCTSEH